MTQFTTIWFANLADQVMKFEGLRTQAYVCGGGRFTLGFGSTRLPDGLPVKMGDTCTEHEAELMLFCDLVQALMQVNEEIPNAKTAAQVGWASFVHNLGIGNMTKSRALMYYRDGNMVHAEREFKEWRLAQGKVMPGLVTRRAWEWGQIELGGRYPA